MVLKLLLVTPFLLLFSLLTYRMKDEVFRTWLHFAYWWVPILIAVTYFSSINFGTRTGGAYGFGGVGQWLLLELLYGIFIFVSLLIIVWKYLATRHSTS
ncbi:MAG: hypothetical protein ACYCZZ_02105 [Minisyncoccota bacterium]